MELEEQSNRRLWNARREGEAERTEEITRGISEM